MGHTCWPGCKTLPSPAIQVREKPSQPHPPTTSPWPTSERSLPTLLCARLWPNSSMMAAALTAAHAAAIERWGVLRAFVAAKTRSDREPHATADPRVATRSKTSDVATLFCKAPPAAAGKATCGATAARPARRPVCGVDGRCARSIGNGMSRALQHAIRRKEARIRFWLCTRWSRSCRDVQLFRQGLDPDTRLLS